MQLHLLPVHVGAVLHPEEASQHWAIVHGGWSQFSSGSGDLIVPEPQSVEMNFAQLSTAVMQEHSVHSAVKQTVVGLLTIFPSLQGKPSQFLAETTGSKIMVTITITIVTNVLAQKDLSTLAELQLFHLFLFQLLLCRTSRPGVVPGEVSSAALRMA